MDADERRKVTVGLDLGASMGWAEVHGVTLLMYGVHRLKDKSMAQRCSLMATFIRSHLLCHRIAMAGAEQPPYVKRAYINKKGEQAEGGNLRTYGILNQYLGVANAVFMTEGTPVTSINAMTLKKWATGYGHSSKEEVQKAMARLSGCEDLLTMPSDVADAVACAYYVNELVDPDFWADMKDWRMPRA